MPCLALNTVPIMKTIQMCDQYRFSAYIIVLTKYKAFFYKEKTVVDN